MIKTNRISVLRNFGDFLRKDAVEVFKQVAADQVSRPYPPSKTPSTSGPSPVKPVRGRLLYFPSKPRPRT